MFSKIIVNHSMKFERKKKRKKKLHFYKMQSPSAASASASSTSSSSLFGDINISQFIDMNDVQQQVQFTIPVNATSERENKKQHNYKEEERKRKDKYLGDFKYQDSDAFNLMKLMCIKRDGTPVKKVKATMIKSIISCIQSVELKSGNVMPCPGVSKKGIPQSCKFIQDNIALFKEYYNKGARLMTDEIGRAHV